MQIPKSNNRSNKPNNTTNMKKWQSTSNQKKEMLSLIKFIKNVMIKGLM